MTDIIEFLRARLNEDEQVAKACGDLRWSIETTMHREHESEPAYPVAMVNPVFIDTYTPDGMTFDVADCQHAARCDPARALAEVEAKRTTLDVLARCADVRWTGTYAVVEEARRALHALTLPYVDHPQYDPTWAPMEVP